MDELKPAAEIEYEVQVTASGRKYYTVRMKAIAASNLPLEAAKVFRPYVCFVAYGAGVKSLVSPFETKSKYNNAFPIFNEEFTFQTTGDWKKIDIQISVKVNNTRELVATALPPSANVAIISILCI